LRFDEKKNAAAPSNARAASHGRMDFLPFLCLIRRMGAKRKFEALTAGSVVVEPPAPKSRPEITHHASA
jgi:hypothetical protein